MSEPRTFSVEDALRLSAWFARRYSPQCEHLRADLVQIGTVAMLQAYQRGDPLRNRRAYAIACGRGRMLRALTKAAKVRRREGVSLNFRLDDDFEPLADELPADIPGPVEVATAQDSARRVRQAVEALSPRARRIIELRFFEGRSLVETGAAIGLSGERARQLEKAALTRLKHRLRGSGVE